MNRQQYKFEMESGADLIPHLDASPGTSPHKRGGAAQKNVKIDKKDKEKPVADGDEKRG